jgi:hypothetical protein
MPYLRPETVLEEFSGFTLSTVRPAIREDEEFVRGQTGSMASTLRFLAGELEARAAMVDEQERALREALDAVADTTADAAVAEAVDAAVADLDDAPGRVREREGAVLEAADDVLAAVDTHLEGKAAREARRPVYGFLDARTAGQLRMLGREPGPEGEREGREGDQ